MGSLLRSGSSPAMDGAAPLLLGLHGRLLRLLCAHAGCHFEGLAVAGRYLFKQGAIDSATKKKLQNLDVVAAFLRHVSEPLCEGIVANVGDQLKKKDKKEEDEKGDEKEDKKEEDEKGQEEGDEGDAGEEGREDCHEEDDEGDAGEEGHEGCHEEGDKGDAGEEGHEGCHEEDGEGDADEGGHEGCQEEGDESDAGDVGEEEHEDDRDHPGVSARGVGVVGAELGGGREVSPPPPPSLTIGDIVFTKSVQDSPGPFRVYRVGWGSYEFEVRVHRLDEDTNVFSSGHWRSKDALVKLEFLDSMVVYREGLLEALEGRRKIPKGTECQFWGFDEDGDVKLTIGCDRTIICSFDLVYLDML